MGPEQHPLELGAGVEEFPVLLLGAEPHDPLDSGPVVPAPVEEHDLPGGREMGHVALKIPLGPLPLGGLGQGNHADLARVQRLDDPLDDAPLAGRVPALEEDHDLEALPGHPVLQLGQLHLQPPELGFVDFPLETFATRLHFAAGG